MPHILREYALLADGERGAIVGPSGEIAWLCVPRWDSDSVFSGLIGGFGHYTVTPSERYVWGGYYEEGSMIWRSRWVTERGQVECREALAFPADAHRAVLLRRIIAVDTPVRMRISLNPRGGYDTQQLVDAHRTGDIWTACSGDVNLRWSGAERAALQADQAHQGWEFELELEPGGHHDLILELSDRALPDDVPDADQTWRATESAWQAEVPRLDSTLTPRDARRSYAVLRGLTSSGGGMVAAATTSLPERAEAGRNYDYRYVWIRDQCYAGQAIAALGGYPLLDDALSFVADRLLDHGDQLAPAYTTTGEAVPDQRHLTLPGYPGGFDIVGNWVNKQFQLDAFGETLLLFAAGHERLTAQHWEAAERAVAAIARRWNEPDAGIWEIDDRAWTHSRLTAAAGLRAIAAVDRASGSAADWLALADRIVASTSATSLNPAGHWQRSPEDAALDAALLLPGLRGAVPGDDPRTVATLEAYLRDLTRDGYAYRFRQDDRPLHEAEGSFLLCGFLVAMSMHQQDRPVEARAWFEQTRAATGPPQLFSEEYDAHQHQMRGNLPQAFVHAVMLEAAATLAQ